ncbi:MAG TPA: 3,4-dihydroxy-2-butanone-4-phosphate synthase [Acetobacteraceae bacterium]|nr:3,4-dihydroxy-2-butanone-4-phosphate synthase [Acetobacteraceae bacterium]
MGTDTLASRLSSTTKPADASSYAPRPGLLRLPSFARPDTLIDAIRAGRPVILCDDEDRENEGDLVFAAQFASPALVAFMIRQCGGLICIALAPTLVARFGLAPMVRTNRDPKGTAFTASVDAAVGIGTGISARDRARTIRLLGDVATTPDDLVSPGHVFPLAARAGGLEERQGHTESGVVLAEGAGLVPAAAICEILGEDGEAMLRDELLPFAAANGFLIGTVAALAEWARSDAILTC